MAPSHSHREEDDDDDVLHELPSEEMVMARQPSSKAMRSSNNHSSHHHNYRDRGRMMNQFSNSGSSSSSSSTLLNNSLANIIVEVPEDPNLPTAMEQEPALLSDKPPRLATRQSSAASSAAAAASATPSSSPSTSPRSSSADKPPTIAVRMQSKATTVPPNIPEYDPNHSSTSGRSGSQTDDKPPTLAVRRESKAAVTTVAAGGSGTPTALPLFDQLDLDDDDDDFDEKEEQGEPMNYLNNIAQAWGAQLPPGMQPCDPTRRVQSDSAVRLPAKNGVDAPPQPVARSQSVRGAAGDNDAAPQIAVRRPSSQQFASSITANAGGGLLADHTEPNDTSGTNKDAAPKMALRRQSKQIQTVSSITMNGSGEEWELF
eukprot:CAMPEP_0168719652 /NCGR_PEP_ID=MMETSP0724-20121128/1149_1 /TAXON_ID=265536 /ORGANISM="Amphiprora sp., Strain CCMP467" /LENGTH=372 /DNA_ID=CAMNT_0008766213 /DNA_START=133 /DNA_END=1251 /DNA_ORIENTATION=+